MAIRLEWGHLADYAAEGAGGKMTLVGIFQRIYVPKDAPQVQMPMCYLAAQIGASIVDGAEHTVRLRLLDGNGHPVSGVPFQLPATFGSAGPGYGLSTNVAILLVGIPLPGVGDYALEIAVDDVALGTVAFVVARQPS